MKGRVAVVTKYNGDFEIREYPVPEVEPTTEDLLSQDEAQVALGYCNWAAQQGVTGFPRKLARAHWWAIVAGTAWLKWTWDSVDKKPAVNYVDPFSMFLDPYAEDWDNRFAIAEAGAVVHPDARVHDSVVLRGGKLDAGAVVVQSLVCGGVEVRRGAMVADSVLTRAAANGKRKK